MTNRKLLFLAVVCLTLFGFIFQPCAFAASDIGNPQLAAFSAADLGLGNNAFQMNLQRISTGMVVLMRVVATCFILLGGLMVAFNVESANKLLWNVMLGVGLALNFFTVITGLFDAGGFGASPEPFSYRFDLANGHNGETSFNFIGDFTREYENYCKEGARVIAPVACKLLLCLTGIQGGMKIALGMISGDKMKFLIETVLKTGFFMFLILNWFNGDYQTAGGSMQSSGMNLAGSLMEGFRHIGFMAGGFPSDMPNNNIIAVAVKMFTKGMSALSFSVTQLFYSLSTLIALIAMVILLFLTGFEMIMARLEFVTIAMISVIMIPWGALQQTQFLFTSTISAMFSMAVKVSVIAFIEAMSCTILTNYCEQFVAATDNSGWFGNFPLLLQIVFISIMLYLITKHIPELARGLVSGQPSMGGASMTAMAKNVTHTAGSMATGAVTGVGMARTAVGLAHAGAKAVGDDGKPGGIMGGFKAAGTASKNIAGQSILGRKDQYTGFRQGGLLSGIANAALKGNYLAAGYPEQHPKNLPESSEIASKINDSVLAERMRRYGE